MSWIHRVLGKDGASQLAVDPVHFAARTSDRPMELGATGGAFGLGVVSGVMAAGLAGNAEIFQARWVHASFVCLLRSIRFSAWRNTTAFTVGMATFEARMARGWTVDGGAGTAIVMSTANTNKKRTSLAISKFSDTGVRQSATAALTAGTKTLDANPFATCGCFVSSAAVTVELNYLIPPGTVLWQRDTSDEYPFEMVTNEGFVIRATVPATGTWAWALQFEWAELDPAVVSGW